MTATTHSFADDHGNYRYQPYLDWLTSAENVPEWNTLIPKMLGLKEPGWDTRCQEFICFLKTTKGALLMHLWFYTAYNYKMREDVERIGQDKVTAELNARGNSVYESPEINEFIHKLRAENKDVNNDDWTVASGGILVTDQVGTMFARLFNYHHCVKLGRLPLFNCSPRSISKKHECPVCGAIFGSKGYVYSPPKVDVRVADWSIEDKVEGGSNTHETRV